MAEVQESVLTEQEFRKELVQALPKLQRVALAFVRNKADADDLVNDTVVKALCNRGQFRAGTNMIGWLTVICRNHLFSQKRRKKWLVDAKDYEIEGIAQPESQFNTVLTLQTIDAVDQLKPTMREAIYIVGFSEATYEEASKLLDVPLGTMKSRVCRARKALVEKLEVRDAK